MNDAKTLASLELNFRSGGRPTIVLSTGTQDAKNGTPLHQFQQYLEHFITNLKRTAWYKAYGLNIAFIKPRHDRKRSSKDQELQACLTGTTFNQLIQHFPGLVMYTLDSRDFIFGDIYRALFRNFFKEDIPKLGKQIQVQQVPKKSFIQRKGTLRIYPEKIRLDTPTT